MATLSTNFSVTESALLLVGLIERDFISSLDGRRKRPRIVKSSFGTLDPLQVLYQTTILRLVSTTEAYLDALNSHLLHLYYRRSGSESVGDVASIEKKSSANWNARQKAFLEYHGVVISDQRSWKEVDAAIAARNSIAHGLGTITNRQLQQRDLEDRLRTIGIRISGRRLAISDHCINLTVEVCLEFIRGVDEAISKSSG